MLTWNFGTNWIRIVTNRRLVFNVRASYLTRENGTLSIFSKVQKYYKVDFRIPLVRSLGALMLVIITISFGCTDSERVERVQGAVTKIVQLCTLD